jgi:hypothetical protein
MDKVKLHAQERLDLDDTRALQSLIYDYVQEALGGLMGNAHGVFSIPTAITSENGGNPVLYLRPFTFVTSVPMEVGSTGQPLGTSVVGGTEYTQFKTTVVNYDPEEEATQGIGLTYLRANFDQLDTYYIWARPNIVDTDTGTRRKWDITSGAEITQTVETRESQRVVFQLSPSEPISGDAWAKIGVITSFTDGDNAGSVPNIQWYSVFDDPLINTLLDTVDTTVDMSTLLALREDTPFDGGKSYRTFALPLLLTELRKQIAQIKGFPSTSPWTNSVSSALTLLGLNTRLITVEQKQLAPVQCIASGRVAIERSVVLAGEGYYAEYVGSSYGIDRQCPLIASVGSQQNRVSICIDTSVLEEGWAVTHISVTQDMNRAYSDPQDPSHYDYNRVTFVVDPNAYTADTSDIGTMSIDTGTASQRGVVIEFLPQIMDDGLHLHEENQFHPPNGVATDTTTVLRDLVLTATDTHEYFDLLFSVSVFAVPSADADN